MVVFMIVLVMTMMMFVVMMRMPATIGATQRAENCRYIRNPGTKPLKHRLDDVIAKDEDAIDLDLRREMPVPDMPGELGYVERITPADFV